MSSESDALSSTKGNKENVDLNLESFEIASKGKQREAIALFEREVSIKAHISFDCGLNPSCDCLQENPTLTDCLVCLERDVRQFLPEGIENLKIAWK